MEGKRGRKGKKGRKKIRRIISNLKDGKAAGIDRMPNEIWKYKEEDLVEWA